MQLCFQEEHPNPGYYFIGLQTRAFLPDTPEGQKVLGLLRQAFDAKLTFTVGLFVTCEHDILYCVTWNDIQHKTNKFDGPNRYSHLMSLFVFISLIIFTYTTYHAFILSN